MTETHLQLLIWFHLETKPHELTDRVLPFIEDLRSCNMLTEGNVVTSKGVTWLDHILNTPLPVQVWEIPADE